MKVYVITEQNGCGEWDVKGVVSDIEMAKRVNAVDDMDWEEFELDELELPDFAAGRAKFAEMVALSVQHVHDKFMPK